MVRALLLMVSCSLLGCEPKLVVGERTVTGSGGSGAAGTPGASGTSGTLGTSGTDGGSNEAGDAGAQCSDNGAAIPAATDPIVIPWSTGFENEFCDYELTGGFCFGGGTHRVVTSPVHSGSYAAEFTVASDQTDKNQARCVRQGVLPVEAYYGAWYYVPVLASLDNSTSSLWNLWHFQGGDTSQDGLWDVTLINGADGNLQLLVYDFLNGTVRKPANPPAIPIGAWFHIQFYLKRAADATGEIRLYQDGKLLLEKTNLITDDSSWGQWYVGNIAKELTPAASTLYVDDVSIGSTGISL